MALSKQQKDEKAARAEAWDDAAKIRQETSPDAADSTTKADTAENEVGDSVTIQTEERGPAK